MNETKIQTIVLIKINSYIYTPLLGENVKSKKTYS